MAAHGAVMRDNHHVPTEQMSTPRRSKSAGPDAILAAALEQARCAAVDVLGPGAVGPHLWVISEGDRLVTHAFSCDLLGYRGWTCSVTLARAPRAKNATVSEVNLLPGADAQLPPEWLPWSERIQPGDLAPGDVLPRTEADPLLDQGYMSAGDEESDRLAQWELGLGRVRVLSRAGREAAAGRWYAGAGGPRDPHAESASAACGDCGFYLQLPGELRRLFGVCANEWSPSDGQVVSLDHGCGAHSEIALPERRQSSDTPVLDDLALDALPMSDSVALPAAVEGAPTTEEAPTVEVPVVEDAQDSGLFEWVGATAEPAAAELAAPEPGVPAEARTEPPEPAVLPGQELLPMTGLSDQPGLPTLP